MNKQTTNQGLPAEVLGFLWTLFPVTIILPGILVSMLLPAITGRQPAEVVRLYWVGLAAGAVGAVLLFFARLPLYRQRRFFAVGRRSLDPLHRRLYWIAYLCVGAGVVCLGIVWLSSRP
jgi:hypothetical protein